LIAGGIRDEELSMKTKVVLTVDTEPSIAGAFAAPETNTPLIDEPISGDVDGKSEGLGFLIRTLSAYGLQATFFVETVHTSYFPATAMGRYVEQLQAAGQDVQLHLHPSWLTFANGGLSNDGKVTDHCHELGHGELVALIEKGCEQIRAWTGCRPTGMRTGNFSTALNVFEAMRETRLENASNICLAMHRPAEEELWKPAGCHRIAGIRELPVTCFVDNGPVGRGKLRPLQVTALGAAEHIGLLRQAYDKQLQVVVIVTHPFEYLKKKDFRYRGLRANRMIQSRFETLCAFLAENGDKFSVASLEAAARETEPEDPPPLRGHPLQAALRAAANVINDRLL
jgi:hypothetical protein